MIVLLGIAAIPAGMVLFCTRDLSSAIIIMGIAALMIFVADPKYKKYIVIGLLCAAAVAGVIYYVSTLEMDNELHYRLKRVLAWRNPEAFVEEEGYQTLQALYAIGSGGIWGKGLGQSMQKLGFIPEAQNDMIFSIICEELGLFGAIAIIIMFVMLLWRMMVIANNAPDLFGAMIVVGVMGHIAIQVILNIAVVTNTIPNTGISLPFISYGGTSVLFLLIEIGLVLSVAKRIQLREVN
jgi:cell division protein FtsW